MKQKIQKLGSLKDQLPEEVRKRKLEQTRSQYNPNHDLQLELTSQLKNTFNSGDKMMLD